MSFPSLVCPGTDLIRPRGELHPSASVHVPPVWPLACRHAELKVLGLKGTDTGTGTRGNVWKFWGIKLFKVNQHVFLWDVCLQIMCLFFSLFFFFSAASSWIPSLPFLWQTNVYFGHTHTHISMNPSPPLTDTSSCLAPGSFSLSFSLLFSVLLICCHCWPSVPPLLWLLSQRDILC